jgi:hypothetical protein
MLRAVTSDRLKRIQARIRLRSAERAVAVFPSGRRGRPHGLPGELVVSLTSYPPRFPTLGKTLRSLLSQTVAADRTVLWLTEEHRKLLPLDVELLALEGLTIGICEDLRSYAKIIPSLRRWPQAYIATADDDLYYGPRWLETLVRGVLPEQRVIVCRRAHRPRRMGDGYAPYQQWDWDFLTDGEVREDLFPTGVAGVLYPPASLSTAVLDCSKFMKLCPTADDVWLYWMGRLAGSKVKQVGGGFAQVAWTGSQDISLVSENMDGRNDEQLQAVMAAYPKMCQCVN